MLNAMAGVWLELTRATFTPTAIRAYTSFRPRSLTRRRMGCRAGIAARDRARLRGLRQNGGAYRMRVVVQTHGVRRHRSAVAVGRLSGLS